ncbi:MAG: DUF4279 domain-containing protein [Planctomycetes bacterium]|nr:DUF4279 domain-containing protein [Planctomycetota bacterium]
MNVSHKKQINEEFSICFRLFGNDLKSLELSKHLGVKPTFFNVKNKKKRRCKNSFTKRSYSFWGIVAPVERTKELESHINWLSNLFEKNKCFIKNVVRKGVRMDVLISCHYIADRQLGFTLSDKFLSICGKLGISLSFDIYTYVNFN